MLSVLNNKTQYKKADFHVVLIGNLSYCKIPTGILKDHWDWSDRNQV